REYVFTDISPTFVNRARETLGGHPFLRCGVLDVERDPADQGYAAHAFDVALAANVLHATTDLRRTLSHVQQLIKPGGLLLLLEGSRTQRWIDLTFGLTPGWWKFSDVDLRQISPLLE